MGTIGQLGLLYAIMEKKKEATTVFWVEGLGLGGRSK